MKPYLALMLLVLVSARTASAEPRWLSEQKLHGDWRIESGVDIGADVFGKDFAKAVSPGYPGVPIDGSTLEQELGYVRFRISLFSKYFEFEAQPYTQVPHGWFHVATAGLELWLFFPLTDWLRVGLYHHSYHNFSDGTYGEGLELDAGVFDLKMLDRRFSLAGDEGRCRLRLLGYGFILGLGSAYQLTPKTMLDSEGIVGVTWRGAIDAEVTHRLGQFRFDGVVWGNDRGVPSSMRLDTSLLAHVGGRFLGPVGEHLLVGPFYSYRRNFGRISDFGRDAHSAGVLLSVLFTDDPDINRAHP